MKTMKVPYLLCLSLLALLFAACKDDKDPSPTGDIKGKVYLYNEYGDKQSLAEGITVSIDGTDIKTTTDATGKYTLSKVKAGTYDLTFSKEGYPTMFAKSVAHVGGTAPTYSNEALNKKPDYYVTTPLASTGMSGTHKYLILQASLSNPLPTGKQIKVVTYAHSTSNVSPSTGKLLDTSYPTNQNFTSNIYSYEFEDAGFESGETIYVVMYTDSWNTNYYYSYEDDIYIYPSMNTTNATVIRTVVP